MHILKVLSVAGLANLVVPPAGAAPPAAPAQSGKLPAPVAAELRSLADQCREVGGRPATGAAVRQADLTGDGRPDFILDVSAMDCAGAASLYGDREKAIMIFVGDGAGGASLAFRDAVYGVTLEGSGSGAKLWVTVAGAACGRSPAPDFASEHFCDRAVTWSPATRRFDYAPVATVRMIE